MWVKVTSSASSCCRDRCSSFSKLVFYSLSSNCVKYIQLHHVLLTARDACAFIAQKLTTSADREVSAQQEMKPAERGVTSQRDPGVHVTAASDDDLRSGLLQYVTIESKCIDES